MSKRKKENNYRFNISGPKMVTKKSPFEKKNAFFLPMAKEKHIIELYSHWMQLEKEHLVKTF